MARSTQMDLEDFVVTDLPDEVAATLTDTAVVEEAPPLMDLAVRLGWVVCAALCLFVVSGGIAAVIR